MPLRCCAGRFDRTVLRRSSSTEVCALSSGQRRSMSCRVIAPVTFMVSPSPQKYLFLSACQTGYGHLLQDETLIIRKANLLSNGRRKIACNVSANLCWFAQTQFTPTSFSALNYRFAAILTIYSSKLSEYSGFQSLPCFYPARRTLDLNIAINLVD